MRHAVFANGNFNFHAGIVNLTQHLFDSAHRLAKQRWWLGQLHHDDLACFGRTCCTLGYQDILAVAFVFRRYQPYPAFLQQPANDGVRRAFNDFSDAAFRPIFTVVADDTRLDAVLVQDGAHFIRWQVNVGFAIVALYETVAITVAGNGTLEFC